MIKKKEFFRTFITAENAAEFAEKIGGTVIDTYTVKFMAAYSISKALYSVSHDMYKVFIRVRPESAIPLTYVIYAKTSKEAYEGARRKVKHGYL